MSRTWKSSNLSDDEDWAIRRFTSQYFVYLLALSRDKEIVFTLLLQIKSSWELFKSYSSLKKQAARPY